VLVPLASAAVRAILAIGGSAVPRANDIRIDGPVFLFAAAAARTEPARVLRS
jgi:hypothetical protein